MVITMYISSYGLTHTGSSGINGDVFYASPDKKVFLLADGASGAGAEGKVLMGKTCIEIVKLFDYSASNLDPKEYVDKLFWKINNRLIALSQKHRKLVYGTIDIAIIDNGLVTITALGDSPVYYFNGIEIKRIAKNPKRYEWMIDAGYITREQYQEYINQMHEMMWCCFDYFIPEVVPNNVIEQFEIKPNDILFMCCDGLSDWVSEDRSIKTLLAYGLEVGVKSLIAEAKEISNNKQSSYDDITAIAIKCIE